MEKQLIGVSTTRDLEEKWQHEGGCRPNHMQNPAAAVIVHRRAAVPTSFYEDHFAKGDKRTGGHAAEIDSAGHG